MNHCDFKGLNFTLLEGELLNLGQLGQHVRDPVKVVVPDLNIGQFLGRWQRHEHIDVGITQ